MNVILRIRQKKYIAFHVIFISKKSHSILRYQSTQENHDQMRPTIKMHTCNGCHVSSHHKRLCWMAGDCNFGESWNYFRKPTMLKFRLNILECRRAWVHLIIMRPCSMNGRPPAH